MRRRRSRPLRDAALRWVGLRTAPPRRSGSNARLAEQVFGWSDRAAWSSPEPGTHSPPASAGRSIETSPFTKQRKSRRSPTPRARRLLATEAVAQTITGLNFLYVCDKVTILGRTISVAEDPLCPAEPLSRGQRNWPLSDSYDRFGLCDSLNRMRPRARAKGAGRSRYEATPRRPPRLVAVSVGLRTLGSGTASRLVSAVRTFGDQSPSATGRAFARGAPRGARRRPVADLRHGGPERRTRRRIWVWVLRRH